MIATVPVAAAAPVRISLVASPSHLNLWPGARRTVRITATGGGSLRVEADVAGYGLDAQGRPRVGPARDAAPWLSVEPRRLTIGRGGATLVVASRRPAHARAGDHTAVVLLSAIVPSARGVVVRMRVGLAVSVRVAGRIVHRVAVIGARSGRVGNARVLEVTLANRGNVIETIRTGHLRVTLIRNGRVAGRYLTGRRELLPQTRGIVRLRVRGRVRGVLTARVELWRTAHGWAVRRFHLRL